jgi:hypothetical protein
MLGLIVNWNIGGLSWQLMVGWVFMCRWCYQGALFGVWNGRICICVAGIDRRPDRGLDRGDIQGAI